LIIPGCGSLELTRGAAQLVRQRRASFYAPAARGPSPPRRALRLRQLLLLHRALMLRINQKATAARHDETPNKAAGKGARAPLLLDSV